SYNHTILTTVSDATIKSEISKTNNLVKQYTGQTVKTVRAPGGSVNDNVKKVVAYPLVNWSVDTMDWSNRNSAATYANFKANVTDGSIVLMHDLYPSTAEATKSIVTYLKQNGYQIVTVSELMDAKGVRFTSGYLYNSANS
ncbi:MAG: polysaccharide deacetylase family protein, partial [Acutalibacteraceae bacterium]